LVTNLPEEAKAKWAHVVAARTPGEKLRAMREFVSLCPKHKGTERLLAHVKRQMAILRRESNEGAKRQKSGGPKLFVEKEGAAQIVMIGPTKTGRSSLLASLTNAEPLIASYEFATMEPEVGMLNYEDIQFQLVEAPALVPGAAEGVGWGAQTLGLARNSDGLMIVVDLSTDASGQLEMVINELDSGHILVLKPRGRVEIDRQGFISGIQVVGSGRLINCTADDIRRLLTSYRTNAALVKISGEVTLEDVENALFEDTSYKPAIVVANKADASEVEMQVGSLRNLIAGRLEVFPVSCLTGYGISELREGIFRMLDILRVYTKEPGEEAPSPQPIIMRKGDTVVDAAKQIHSRLYKGFLYAKIWGSNAKYPGERVGANRALSDGDILEIHAKQSGGVGQRRFHTKL